MESAAYSSPRWSDGGEAWFSIQKDGRFTRHQRLLFTVNGPWWGAGRIYELMPQGATDTWWEIDGPQTDQVAGSFIAAIRLLFSLPDHHWTVISRTSAAVSLCSGSRPLSMSLSLAWTTPGRYQPCLTDSNTTRPRG